jgi:hypothetical protein
MKKEEEAAQASDREASPAMGERQGKVSDAFFLF